MVALVENIYCKEGKGLRDCLQYGQYQKIILVQEVSFRCTLKV